MKPNYGEVFEQLKNLDFVRSYAKEYEPLCGFSEETIRIEVWDDFGQCSVWLGFDDQFAIRDAFGNWQEATAEDCILLRKGNLPGAMSLVN